MITIDSVTRTYGASAAVDDASWTARPGWVTGFLGPKGAGKSTIVRIRVGLTRAATSGTSTVSGRSHVNLPNPGREDGVLLDAPAQHAGRTGREILTIALPDRGWHTRELAVRHRAGALAGLMVVVASLTGCIASDVEVIGALGVTVDEEQRPVVVVEACKGTATGVHLSFDRKGLSEDEENEQVAAWTSGVPVPGTSELVLSAPAGPWAGESVEVVVDRGYIATAVGEGDREVLSQVTFRGEDFAAMEPGTVYTNDTDPDARELVGRIAEDFTADVCSRD